MPAVEHLDAATRDAIRDYYAGLYRDALGLPDWQRRAEDRLDEERLIGERMVSRLESWFGCRFEGKRVLVVGTATGAEFFVLRDRGAAVHGIDLNPAPVALLHRKSRLRGRPAAAAVGAAEALPFANEAFDFVYCYTVLEHVADVERSIDEMLRVCRSGGDVFIQTPDYRFPFEGHYKLSLIPFAPRAVQRLYLRLRGRPSAFLRHINFVTVAQLNRIFWFRNVITIRAWAPEPAIWKATGHRWMVWFSRTFAVQKHQYILLRKRAAADEARV
jgi:SAM-dependent methyltransferase